MPSFKEYRLPQYKGIESLTLTTVDEIPKPKYDEVLVKLKAASLNFRDLVIAKGQYSLGMKQNVVPCSDASGEIVEVGDGVTDWKVGDRVMSNFNVNHIDGDLTNETMGSALGGGIDGVLTQYRTFKAHSLVSVPKHLSYEEAATLPCAALTAWNSLFGQNRLMPGQTVLLQGTGGVSVFGLQLAHAAGAITIVTSSSDEKLEIAKKLGATHTINYNNNPNWDEEVNKITNGRGVDHILEVGGPGTLAKSFKSIRIGGQISTIGFVAGPTGEDVNIPMQSLSKAVNFRGILIGSRRQFEDMNKLLEARQIKPVVDKVFAFEDAQKAYQHLESQKHVGKVVIKINE